jgi:hypothetical protein
MYGLARTGKLGSNEEKRPIASTETSRITINSIPALAAAIRTVDRDLFAPRTSRMLAGEKLVPMYRVRDISPDSETRDSLRVVEHVVDRLRRLAEAYGAWQDFDVGAYFDLTEDQASRLVMVTERVSTVHVVFQTDLLIPTFRSAIAFWAGQFVAAHSSSFSRIDSPWRAGAPLAFDDDFALDTQPSMLTRWNRLLGVVEEVRATLVDDPGFVATLATQETQMRWRRLWASAPAEGLSQQLRPDLMSIPTLTLSFDFPLPAHRQPGRLRRLRLNRERRQKRHDRGL